MARKRVADFLPFLNPSPDLSEDLPEKYEAYLYQMKAMLEVAVLTDGFYDLSKTTLHNYFSSLLELTDNVLADAGKS